MTRTTAANDHVITPDPVQRPDVCRAIGGEETSPYVAEWLPLDDGPGASYIGEQLALPSCAGEQQLAFAPIAEGLGLFAHQGIWYRPGVISGYLSLPEPYIELRLPLAGTTRILTASGTTVIETPRQGLLSIEHSGEPCEHHNPVGEFNSRLAVLVTASQLRMLFVDQPLGDRLAFIKTPDAWPTIHDSIAMNATLQRICMEIMHHHLPNTLSRLFLTAKTLELISYVLAAWHQPAIPGHPIRGSSARDRQRAQQARDILRANLGHPPLVHELARSLGLSQRKLNHLFRECYGGSVIQCLGQWRMEYARALLRADTHSLKEIAFQLGYDHCQNFISAFQRQVGMPPGEFRARARPQRLHQPPVPVDVPA
ncbi:helix-turn-helix domain-containing protein [Thiocapsa imhoffii]|uniref:helix-turn-helix domain-containing protein n=1 Tax=Thiocapsa imhoffii TaxID=382777 RepID=UPI001906DED4